jgi:alpha-glucosidase
VLYQGDEIGQVDTDVPHELMRDPLGVMYWPAYAGRDAMRTPMPWTDGPGGGFTDPGVEPWLPLGDLGSATVAAQRDDPDSMLSLTRDLIALRRETPELQVGPYLSLMTPSDLWAWSRGRRMVVAANMTDGEGALEGVSGVIRLATDRRRDGSAVDGTLWLRGWEAVVVDRGPGGGSV